MEAVTPYVTQCVQADATDEEFLRSFDPASFDAAIVAIGTNVRDSVLMALLCKEAGAPMVIAKAMDELHAKLLTKIGVDRVIFPERDMGQRLARFLCSKGMLEVMELDEGYQIAEVLSPAAWAGKTLMELDVRRKYGVSVVGIKRAGGFVASPGGDSRLEAGDTLVMMGHEDAIDTIDHL